MIAAISMAQQANHPLPAGFQLDEYRIERQLSLGGFSIVYLATGANGESVAIKEYLPNSLALRPPGEIKPIIDETNMPAFRYGMKCFFEEGRTLARLSHPNIIRVLNFFRANDTVYMVMEYEHGSTLQEFIQKNPALITENFIRNVFTKLLNGLREVHSNKLLHLDIKPSNIYMRNDYAPVLIDFGAARQTLIGEAHMLKPMYTPGFASPELYGQRDTLGPWSDLYSIGACMYACLTKKAPQAADSRIKADQLIPAVSLRVGHFSRHLLETIDWCLHLDPLGRPQSAFTLQKSLTSGVAQPRTAGKSWLAHIAQRIKRTVQR